MDFPIEKLGWILVWAVLIIPWIVFFVTAIAPEGTFDNKLDSQKTQQSEKTFISKVQYSSYKIQETVPGIFGNPIERYSVYIINKGQEPAYFTVEFYFKDRYGRSRITSLTNYIYPNQQKRFFHQDINPEFMGYWSYKVIPNSVSTFRN